MLALTTSWLVAFQAPAVPPAAVPPAAAPAAVAAPADVRPTLLEVFKPPRLLGVRPRDPSLSADGRWIAWRWSPTDAEEPKLGWWIAPSDGSAEARQLFAPEAEVDLAWLPTGDGALLFRGGWIERFDVASGASEPLFQCGPRRGRIVFTKAGDRALFVAGADEELWLLDLASGERWSPAQSLTDRGRWFQLLEERDEVVLFAAPPGAPAPAKAAPADKVGDKAADKFAEKGDKPAPGDKPAQPEKPKRVLWRVALPGAAKSGAPVATKLEEGGRIEVSADGRFAAQSTFEPEQKRQLILADYLADSVRAVPVRGDLAGDPPPKSSVTLFDLEKGERAALPLDEGERYYQSDFRWSPAGARLLLQRVSDDFKVRQIVVADPDSGSSRPLFSERDEAWIGGPLSFAQWRGDGEAVVCSTEKHGFAQLLLLPVAGGEAVELTARDSEVQEAQLLEGGRALLAVTNARDPAERSFLRVDLDAASAREIATPRAGCVGDFAVSADGSTVAFLFESLGVPADIWSITTTEESRAVQLSETVPDALRELSLPPPEVVTFDNPADGTKLRALLYRPASPQAGGAKPPAVVFVHGAGYLQNVTRSMTEYPVNYLFHQRLARLGFAVLDVDYRHSAGYGRKFRTDIFGFMGGKDLDDEVAGADWLAANVGVDRARIGLYGGSYGGFLTLMALFTKPDAFACGAALRSVTDWRTYNTWYTTPRLGDPKANAENYRKSSPLDHAEGLTKPLLILHGLKDSNVFAQDSIRLIEKLIQLGKEFDAMVYPSQDHGFTDPESWIDEYRRIERLFVRELKPAPVSPTLDPTTNPTTTSAPSVPRSPPR
jgi:dipeptidyl aminopeptidase/acylaminoacyl peptidase